MKIAMHRISLVIIILFILASCEPKEPLYEDGDFKIYGNQIKLNADISFSEITESVVTFDQLEIEQQNSLYKDTLNAYYALKRNKYYTYLYLLDSFPVGQNWDNKLVEVIRWTMNNVERPVQILDHSQISDKNIEELLNQVDQLKAGGLNLSSMNVALFLKQLYILSLRCCGADEERKMLASMALADFEIYHKLDSSNRDLRNRLVGYLKYE